MTARSHQTRHLREAHSILHATRGSSSQTLSFRETKPQQVEELDTSGVQLLLMLQRLVQQQGGELETVEVSESAGSILQLLRCQAALNLKEIDP